MYGLVVVEQTADVFTLRDLAEGKMGILHRNVSSNGLVGFSTFIELLLASPYAQVPNVTELFADTLRLNLHHNVPVMPVPIKSPASSILKDYRAWSAWISTSGDYVEVDPIRVELENRLVRLVQYS